MARKTQAEIQELFNPYLHDGEEFRWIGEPVKNVWKPNLSGILEAFFDTLESILYVVLIGVARILIQIVPIILVFGVLLTLLGLLLTIILVQVVNALFFISMFYFFLGPAIILLKVRKEIVTRLSLPRNVPEIKKRQFGQRKYYIITNQRSLIFEQGAIHDYSLLLLADAVVNKPKFGTTDIYLYYSTNPTGQLPEPVFQLKGIAEEDAQNAYEILRQTREEALEDRAREMGIE